MSFIQDNPDITEILFTKEEIEQRVGELGAQITRDYAGKNPLVICVLRGAAMFMTDFVRAIDLPVEMDFMAVSSYGSSVQSSGVVRIIKDLDSPVHNRDVIIAEDVIDSGLTLKYLMKNLASRNPASLEIAALLHKHRPGAIESKYVGFDCPDCFIVGYGLDYDEKYRNLPYIGVLNPAVYEK
jgi:hypoxanthine phosphoribosyltransferase